MAITKRTFGDTASSTASGSSLTVTLTASNLAIIGDMMVVAVAADNAGASGASSIGSISDSKGNTWNTGTTNNYAPGAAVSGGVTLVIFWSKATVAMAAGDTITVTFSPNTTSKGMIAWCFTPTSGYNLNLRTVGTGATGTGKYLVALPAPGTMPTTDMFLGAVGAETNNQVFHSWDSSTNWGGQTAVANTGTLATSISVEGESGLGDGTANFNFAGYTANNADKAVNYLIFRETLPASSDLNATVIRSGSSDVLASGVQAIPSRAPVEGFDPRGLMTEVSTSITPSSKSQVFPGNQERLADFLGLFQVIENYSQIPPQTSVKPGWSQPEPAPPPVEVLIGWQSSSSSYQPLLSISNVTWTAQQPFTDTRDAYAVMVSIHGIVPRSTRAEVAQLLTEPGTLVDGRYLPPIISRVTLTLSTGAHPQYVANVPFEDLTPPVPNAVTRVVAPQSTTARLYYLAQPSIVDVPESYNPTPIIAKTTLAGQTETVVYYPPGPVEAPLIVLPDTSWQTTSRQFQPSSVFSGVLYPTRIVDEFFPQAWVSGSRSSQPQQTSTRFSIYPYYTAEQFFPQSWFAQGIVLKPSQTTAGVALRPQEAQEAFFPAGRTPKTATSVPSTTMAGTAPRQMSPQEAFVPFATPPIKIRAERDLRQVQAQLALNPQEIIFIAIPVPSDFPAAYRVNVPLNPQRTRSQFGLDAIYEGAPPGIDYNVGHWLPEGGRRLGRR